MSLNPNRRNKPPENKEIDMYQDVILKPKGTVKPGTFAPPSLFDSQALATGSENFDVVNPAKGTGDVLLQTQNPKLLALRKKRSKEVITPTVTHVQMSTKMPPQHNSSLLFKRPLNNLRDPHAIDSVELHKLQEEANLRTIEFDDDPIAYFSKRKDGRGHRFLFMISTTQPVDPNYDPYTLMKVPNIEPEITDYYTMSALGVTHIMDNGDTDNISLDQWAKEISIFKVLKKMKFFKTYFYWKPFERWRTHNSLSQFNMRLDKIRASPFFRNPIFFKKTQIIESLQIKPKSIIEQYLLCIYQGKKYKLDDYEKLSSENLQKMKAEFLEFIEHCANEVTDMYAIISDPANVQVSDSSFPEVRRRNPNINQLMILEKKKAKARIAKTISTNEEIMKIAAFIRLSDYMIIETMLKTCQNSFKIADDNASNIHASVFTVDVYFKEDGSVGLRPSPEELIGSVKQTIKEALKALGSLPRLVNITHLKPFIRDSGIDLLTFYEQGVNIPQLVKQIEQLDKIVEHISDVIQMSYDVAMQGSSSYDEFYPIYKLGQTWDVRDYLITRKGEKYEGPTIATSRIDEQDSFLINNEDEPVVDLEKVSRDIETFKHNIQQISSIWTGNVKFALFISSNELKRELTPIPEKAIADLQQLLDELAGMKIQLVSRAIQFYSRQLKIEPKTLEDFVEYCRILTRTHTVLPKIETEIEFVDNLYALFDKFNFNHQRNPMQGIFAQFKIDQSNADALKDSFKDPFIKTLKELVHKMERKIGHYYEKATAVPLTLKDADLDMKIPQAKRMKEKVAQLEPEIQELQNYQDLIMIKFNDFSAYKNVVAAADFMIELYETAAKYVSLRDIISKKQFHNIDIKYFREQLDSLQQETKHLQETARANYPLLQELIASISEAYKYADDFELLAKGNMQTRHWNALFEECGQMNGYHPEITMEELISLGILSDHERIVQITNTSRGESELESKYQAINSHWSKVTIPIQEQQRSDESLLIGPTDSLSLEIDDTLIQLQNMLTLQYVSGIRESVSQLSSQLELIEQVLEEWKPFQSNWVILQSLFMSDEARSILPHQANRFATVQRKWVSITRHTSKDPRLFSVIAYPSLLETFQENNQTIESILIALGKYLDTKRSAQPRLFFLSNYEVLTLVSTTDFDTFQRYYIRLFMHVKSLVTRENKMTESHIIHPGQHYQRFKFYGLVGTDGEQIAFSKPINCVGGIEQWTGQVLEQMRSQVLASISNSITAFQSTQFGMWVMSFPAYILILSLYCIFTREVEEAFGNLEHDSKAFVKLDQKMGERIQETIDFLTGPGMEWCRSKSMMLISVLMSFRSKIAYLTEVTPNQSHQFDWSQTLKMEYIQSQNIVQVQFARTNFEHGLEYWGETKQLIITPSIDLAIQNIGQNFANKAIPILTGNSGNGKSSIVSYIASIFGKYLYTLRPQPDISEFIFSRVLIGAASSGSWLLVSNIEVLSHTSISYLIDNIRLLMAAQNAGNPRITISSRLVELDKQCRVLMTASPSFDINPNIPSQMKSMVRPVALRAPSHLELTEVLLSSHGLIAQHENAISITSLVRFVTETCKEALPHTLITTHIFNILRFAETFHGDDLRAKSKIVLAYASAQYFTAMLPKPFHSIIRQLVFNAFHTHSTEEEMFEEINAIGDKAKEELFKRLAQEEIQKMSENLPAEYLIHYAYLLSIMMDESNCIIITGPTHSGKTTVLELYARVTARDEYRRFAKAAEIIPLYFGADSWQHTFGSVINDLTLGQTWEYGSLHSIMNILTELKDTTGILRLDGQLTEEYSNYLSQFLGVSYENCAKTASLDSFSFENIRIVLELGSLEELTPGIISKCQILHMKNTQNSRMISLRTPQIEILHPTIPFSNAYEVVKEHLTIPANAVSAYRSYFCENIPALFDKVVHTPNSIYYTGADEYIQGNDSLLSEILPINAAILMFEFAERAKVDINDPKHMQLLVVYSFYHAFLAFISPENLGAFDAWMRQQYSLDVPVNWDDSGMPDDFVNTFQRPSILSTRVYNGKLIPLDPSPLKEAPVLTEILHPDAVLFSDSLIVTTPQEMPYINTASAYAAAGRDMLIIGEKQTGKSTLIKQVFRDAERYELVYVPQSIQDLQTFSDFLMEHTLVTSPISKNLLLKKRFVLVFEDITPDDSMLIEIIRMIIKERRIPVFSCSDFKNWQSKPMQHFQVVVTTKDIKRYNTRFLGLFSAVSLPVITPITASFIASKTLSNYGIDENSANLLVNFALKIISRFSTQPVIGILKRVFAPFLFLNDDTKKNISELANLTLSQLFTHLLIEHPRDDFKEFMGECASNYSELKPGVEDFLRFTHISSVIFEWKEQNSSPVAQFSRRIMPEFIKEMEFHLKVLNSHASEKVSMVFSAPVSRMFSTILTALSEPGHNIALRGKQGCGRYTMARLAANILEADFVCLSIPTPEELLDNTEKLKTYSQLMKDIFTNAVVYHKNAIIFGRYTKETDSDIHRTLKAITALDYFSFFGTEGVEDIYTKFHGSKPTTPEQRLKIYNDVRTCIKARVKVVVAVDEDEGPLKYSMDVIKVAYNESELFNALSSKIIMDEKMTESLCNKMSDVANLMVAAFNIAKETMPMFHINSVYEFIHMFSKRLLTEMKTTNERRDNIIKATELQVIFEKDLTETEKKMTELKPKLEKIMIESEAFHQSYIARKEAIETRRIKLDEDYEAKKETVSKLSEQVKQYQQDYDTVFPKIDSNLKVIEHMTENDIETVRLTISDPSQSLMSLLEAICIMIERPTDWESGGKQLLNEPEQIIRLHSLFTLESFDDELVKKLDAVFGREDIVARELESIAPSLRSLYEWIHSLWKTAQITKVLDKAKGEFDKESKELLQFTEEMTLEKSSIKQVEENLEVEFEGLNAKIKEKDEMENEFKNIEKRFNGLTNVLKDFSMVTEQWKKSIENFDQIRKQVIGDTFVYAFYVSFCSSMTRVKVNEALSSLKNALKTHNVETSGDPISVVKDKFILTYGDTVLQRIPNFSLNQFYMVAQVLAAGRTPFIVDSDGVISGLVEKSLRPKRFITFPQNATSLEAQLVSAISDGKTLILQDIDCVKEEVVPLLALNQIALDASASREVRVGLKTAPYDPRFRIIMVQNSPDLSKVPIEYAVRSNVVNVSAHSKKSVHDLITSLFVDFFAPQFEKRQYNIAKHIMVNRIEQYKYDRDTLDIISDIYQSRTEEKYDYMEDEENINDLLLSKNALVERISINREAKTARPNEDEYQNVLEQLKPVINLTLTFWDVMSQYLPQVTPIAAFSLGHYEKLIKGVFINEGLHSGSLSQEQIATLAQDITTVTLQHVFSSVKIVDAIFFLFMVTYQIKEMEEKLNWKDLDMAMQHIRDEAGAALDCTSTVPDDGDAFENLKFTNVINIGPMIAKFVEQQFPDYQSFMNFFQVDSIISASATTPTIILTPPNVDPTSLIHYYFNARSRNENFDAVSLNNDLENIKNTKKSVSTAISRGSWVMMHYTKPGRAVANIIVDLFHQMTTSSVNTNFRLILVCSTLDFIPKMMIKKSKRVSVEDFPSVRHSLLQIFHHLGPLVRSSANSNAIKKLSYSAALFMSLMNYRSFVQPIGLAHEAHGFDVLFKDMIEWFKLLIEANPSDIPIRNVRNVLADYAYSSVCNEEDLSKLKAHLAQFFVPETLDDGFTIVRNHKDSDLWMFPPDIPVADFTPHIKNLPVFTQASAMKMDEDTSTALVNWNLTRLISRPFLKITPVGPPSSIDAAQAKVESFQMLLPERIEIKDPQEFSGIMGGVLLGEVEYLNRIIVFVRERLEEFMRDLSAGRLTEAAVAFARGELPGSWLRQLRLGSLTHTTKFIADVIERHSYVTRWVSEGFSPVVDVGKVGDLRKLLWAFLTQCSAEMEIPLEDATFEFALTSAKHSPRQNELYLVNVWMVNGGFKDKVLSVADKKSHRAFQCLAGLKATVVRRSPPKERSYCCPMYHTVVVAGLNDEYVSAEETESVSSNFIWNVSLPTDRPEREWTFAGTVLCTRVPEQFR